MIRIGTRSRRTKIFAMLLGGMVIGATTAITAAWDAADARGGGRGHASVGRASGGFFGGRSGPSRASMRPLRAGGHHARTGHRASLRPVSSFRQHAPGGMRRSLDADVARAKGARDSLRNFRLSGDEREKSNQEQRRRSEADRARRETTIRRQQEAQRRREQFEEADRTNQKLFD
jgi:hypothetical protein